MAQAKTAEMLMTSVAEMLQGYQYLFLGGFYMLTYIAVGVGGAVGSCLRYAITTLCYQHNEAFPFGTLISNCIAGLLIGFVLGIDRRIKIFSPNARLFLTSGLMGGLSTFSAFSMETIDLFKNGKYLLSSANIMLNLCLGFICVIVGMALADFMAKRAL